MSANPCKVCGASPPHGDLFCAWYLQERVAALEQQLASLIQQVRKLPFQAAQEILEASSREEGE